MATQTIPYSETLPAKYENSSLMSPDRREFYLSHKSAARTVHTVPTDLVPMLTVDARMPIDLCCVHHRNDGKKLLVFFPSNMITVAKRQGESSTLTGIATAAINAIKTKSVYLEDNLMARLPRRKNMRNQTGYDRIPVDETTGQLRVSQDYYPILAESKTTKFSLSTVEWYIWLAILSEYRTNRTCLLEFEGKNYFVLQNAYNLVLQQLD